VRIRRAQEFEREIRVLAANEYAFSFHSRAIRPQRHVSRQQSTLGLESFRSAEMETGPIAECREIGALASPWWRGTSLLKNARRIPRERGGGVGGAESGGGANKGAENFRASSGGGFFLDSQEQIDIRGRLYGVAQVFCQGPPLHSAHCEGPRRFSARPASGHSRGPQRGPDRCRGRCERKQAHPPCCGPLRWSSVRCGARFRSCSSTWRA